ncbi:MAG: AAA family ATPase [Candidatus Eremiobacteraeota bacterium]|nr:AAA family ATPase [Candidatus Eremiobacteraeota bacterium]
MVAPRPKVLPLLAYLILQQGRSVERRHIAADLWPDESDEDARANLRRHLQYLRAYLPPGDWLTITNASVAWNGQANAQTSSWIDVVEFRKLSDNPQTYAEAVAIYSGELCEPFDEQWLVEPRRDLSERYASMLLALIYGARAVRNFGSAISYARILLGHDPFREDALRQLLVAQYEAGDRAGALQEYEAFTQRLADELHVPPMSETTAVYEAIRQDIAPAGASRPSADAAHPMPTERPLIGRDSEMAALRERWSQASAGSGNCIVVSGEAGIGKTRLLRELSVFCQSQGGLAATGACSRFELVPYEPWSSVVEALLPLAQKTRVDTVWLQALGPLLDRRSVLPPLEAHRERLRLYEAVATVLDTLSRRRPICIAIEDLHWAGAATLELTAHVIRRLKQSRATFVVTYRDDEQLHQELRLLLRTLKTTAGVLEMPLRPLSAEELRHLTGLDNVESLFERSAGNPLYALELARPEKEAVEGTFAATIRERIGRLPEDGHVLAAMASVCESPFDVEFLQEATGWSASRVSDTLDTLTDERIFLHRTFAGRDALEFRHQLVREAIYESIPSQRRTRYHRRAAHVLERIYPDERRFRIAEIARQWDLAGDAVRASRACLETARVAMSLFAFEDARRPLRRVLELERRARPRFEALLALEKVNAIAGQRTEQHRLLLQATQIEDAAPLEQRCELLRRRIALANTTGDRLAEERITAELRSFAEQNAWPPARSYAFEADAKRFRTLGRFEDERRAFDALTKTDGTPQKYPEAYFAHADALIYQGRTGEAERLLDRLVRDLDSDDYRYEITRLFMAFSRAALARQDYDAMKRHAGAALERSVGMGDREGEALAHHNIANGLVYAFAIDDVRKHYERASELYEMLEHRVGMASIAVDRGLFCTELGLLDDARAFFEAALKDAADIAFRWVVCVAHVNASYRDRLAGDPAGAQAHGLAALEEAKALDSTQLRTAALGVLGCARLMLGDADRAIVDFRQGVELRRGIEPTPRLGDNLRGLAEALAAAGQPREALEVARELYELHAQRPGLAAQPADWLVTLAQIFSQTGDTTTAAAALSAAAHSVRERAARIADERVRTAFLQLPFNRCALEAVTQA